MMTYEQWEIIYLKDDLIVSILRIGNFKIFKIEKTQPSLR